jgi:Uma2 family endonuclease
MAIVIDEAFLPATLTSPPMTDEEFANFCSEHPDLFFEMTADGSIVIMPPTYSLTAARNQEIGAQLQNWATLDGRGISTDASGGFVLPNGARRSPDAAWTSRARLRELSRESLERYWHLCPDFAIELRSSSDRIRPLREKMEEWIANGAQLAWLIDPETRTVEIYRPNRATETVSGESVTGEGPAEGFVLQLARVWDPLAS